MSRCDKNSQFNSRDERQRLSRDLCRQKGHPEPEGAVGVAPEIVHLVETEEDVKNLDIQAEKLIVTNQTTMSQWDVHDIMELVKEKYPHVEYHQEICLATQVRQEAVSEQAKKRT